MILKVSPLAGVAGNVPTVNVGVFDAEEALMDAAAPRNPAVVVPPSNNTTRPAN